MCDVESFVSHVKTVICYIFESYLLALYLFSRLLKRLKVKDPKEIELERLEQGFSIYLNGANAEASRKQAKGSNQRSPSSQPPLRPTCTAGMLLHLDSKLDILI